MVSGRLSGNREFMCCWEGNCGHGQQHGMKARRPRWSDQALSENLCEEVQPNGREGRI